LHSHRIQLLPAVVLCIYRRSVTMS